MKIVPGARDDVRIRTVVLGRFGRVITDSASRIDLRMCAAFDEEFRRDEKGRPRVWTDSWGLDEAWEEAQGRGFGILHLFQNCLLAGEPFQVEIDEASVLSYFEEWTKRALHSARQAVESQQRTKRTPTWAWWLLLVLCGDVFAQVMSHPLVFTISLFFVGGYVMLKYLGLTGVAYQRFRDGVLRLIDEEGAEVGPTVPA